MAPFPAVLYTFATIDYFSSCWKGWNEDKKKQRKGGQTRRIKQFLKTWLKYGNKESQLAVDVWRHKLMHTGEPRLTRNTKTNKVYGWQIHSEGTDNMKLVTLPGTKKKVFQINPFAVATDLREAIFGTGCYFDQLKANKRYQDRFKAFQGELEGYEITIRR